MIEDKEALVSSLMLSYEGIFPNLHQGNIINDYPALIAKIKKICKSCATVICIDKIACIIYREVLKNDLDADNHDAFKHEIENSLSITLSRENYLAIFDLIVEHMPIFIQPIGHSLKSKLDTYNHIVINRKHVKYDLDNVLGRPITTEEINFIVGLFLRYMVFAQDLEAKDNGVKEKIRQIRKIMLNRIDSISAQISESEELINILESMERRPDCDLEVEKANLRQLNENKEHYERQQVNFNLGDGNPYCLDSIKKYGYFSMIFCALSLGLTAPNKFRNFDGNPIIAFLFSIQGLTNFVADHDSATDRVSRIYVQFNKKMKVNLKFKLYVTQLLDCVSKNPGCKNTWRTANTAFQSILPKIIITPKLKLS